MVTTDERLNPRIRSLLPPPSLPSVESLVQPSHDGYQLVDPISQRIYVLYGWNEYVECQPTTEFAHCAGEGWQLPNGTELPRPDMQLKAG